MKMEKWEVLVLTQVDLYKMKPHTKFHLDMLRNKGNIVFYFFPIRITWGLIMNVSCYGKAKMVDFWLI